MPELKAPICRFKDSNNLAEHSTHHHPFATLGPLESHVQPQYVVVNAGRKLFAGSPEFYKFPQVFKQIASHTGTDEAYFRLATVMTLYSHWTKLVVPDDFVSHPRPRSGPSDDADSDDQGQDHAEDGQEEPGEEGEEEPGEEEAGNADTDELNPPLQRSPM